MHRVGKGALSKTHNHTYSSALSQALTEDDVRVDANTSNTTVASP